MKKIMVLVNIILLLGCNCGISQSEKSKLQITEVKNDFYALNAKSEEVFISISVRRELSKPISALIRDVLNPDDELKVVKSKEEKIRTTVILANYINRSWKTEIVQSEHNNEELIEKINLELITLLANNSSIKSLKVKSLQIPIAFYENDQLKGID